MSMPEYRITWNGERTTLVNGEFIAWAIDEDEALGIAWSGAHESGAHAIAVEVELVDDDD